VRQRLSINQKYEADVLKLETDNHKQRTLAAYDAEVASVNAELTLVKKGTEEETNLRVEAINTQLAKELAALDQRKDNAAQETLLHANAAKAITDTRYTTAQANLEKYLQGERNALDERNARGLLKEKDYNRAILAADSMAVAGRLQLAIDYKQDTTALEQQAATAKIAILKNLTAEEKAEADKRVQIAQDFGQQAGQLIADSLFEQGSTIQEFLGKILIMVVDVVEKQMIAQEVAAVASASIQSMTQADSVATFGATGFARIAVLTAAITTFFEIFKAGISHVTAPPQQFASGTVLRGASHANGGIQLYSRSGYHYGEAEEDEIILTKGVFQNPLLRRAASDLNVLGGGKPLAPATHLALGGITSTSARDQLRPQVNVSIDYDRLAGAVSKLRIYTRTSDTKAALAADAYTQSMMNS
jgi:hypothetical protein